LVSPVTVIIPLPAWVNVPVKLPGFEVAVYDVIVEPPLEAGAVNDTDACASPALAVPIVGVPGTVAAAGVTELDGALAAPVPMALVAVTVKV
jgi:hypothetical protein